MNLKQRQIAMREEGLLLFIFKNTDWEILVFPFKSVKVQRPLGSYNNMGFKLLLFTKLILDLINS